MCLKHATPKRCFLNVLNGGMDPETADLAAVPHGTGLGENQNGNLIGVEPVPEDQVVQDCVGVQKEARA